MSQSIPELLADVETKLLDVQAYIETLSAEECVLLIGGIGLPGLAFMPINEASLRLSTYSAGRVIQLLALRYCRLQGLDGSLAANEPLIQGFGELMNRLSEVIKADPT